MEEHKIEKLRKLLIRIESYGRNEKQFEELNKLVNDECRYEAGSDGSGRYYKNLSLTKQNEVGDYLDAVKTRPKKGAAREYRNLILAFTQDIEIELRRLDEDAKNL